jgi:iron complex outermembrane receptor protein
LRRRDFISLNNDLEQEVPGTISRSDALNAPKRAPGANILNDHARDIKSLRLSNKTAFVLDNGWTVEGGLYANDKFLYHPIFQVIDQNSLDVGSFAKLDGSFQAGAHRNEFMAGVNIGRGTNDAKRYVNNRGARGALTSSAEQRAENIEIFGENKFYLSERWVASAGLQAAFTSRDYKDKLNAANNADKNYRSFNPKFGLMFKPDMNSEVYAGLTKSSEAPTFSELVQGAIPGFVPVDLQTAWTAEIGTRGKRGDYSWDATLYHARLKNELLNFTVTPDVPASTFNADDTVHQGLELSLGWRANEAISFHAIYNYNDFYFVDDAQYGGNVLAGAPPHFARLSARFEKDGAFIEPNLEWTPKAAWVDYANTLKSDASAIVGLQAGWDIRDNISLFIDARNLTDEENISSFSTITDARTAGTNIFHPGEGRSLYGGLVIKF